MIDTIKIVSMIDEDTYNGVSKNSIVMRSYRKSTKEIFYEIIKDNIQRIIWF